MQTQVSQTTAAAIAKIKTVPSTSVRYELTRVIDDINTLIKETEAFEPDPDLAVLVNRFFGYFTKSCETHSTMIRRAKWILMMGMVVENRLIQFKYKKSIHYIPDYNNVMYSEMVEMIAVMSEKLSLYFQKHPTVDHYLVAETMSKIIDTTSETKPSQSAQYYSTVKKYGDIIITKLDFAVVDTTANVFIDPMILNDDLFKFLFRLQSYRNRVTRH